MKKAVVLLSVVLTFAVFFVGCIMESNDVEITQPPITEQEPPAEPEPEPIPVTGVQIHRDGNPIDSLIFLTIGDPAITLTAVISPDNATDQVVSWSSGNLEVASVSDGLVTAISPGATTITATAGGISNDPIYITVLEPHSYGIGLDAPDLHVFTSFIEGCLDGYLSTHSLVVWITNTGNQPTGQLSFDLYGDNASAFRADPSSVYSVPVGERRYFRVRPMRNLATGTHTTTVTISGENNISASFSVSITIYEAIRSISLDTSALYTFPDLMRGYAAAERQALTVMVTNTGNKPTGRLNATLTGTNARSFLTRVC